MRTQPIRARERSTLPLSPEEYRFVENSPDFWRLVHEGVVSLERTARNVFGIRAGAFVGRAYVSGRPLIIEEKIEGALGELLGLVGEIDTRVADVRGVVGSSHRVLVQVAERFLNELGTYLTLGRRKSYVRRGFVGGLPRGKVDITSSMRLAAKGRGDQLAYSADELSADRLENQLIGLALHSVDNGLAAMGARPDLLARARTLAVLFDDVSWPRLVRWPLDRLSLLFDLALAERALAEHRTLLDLARIFALHFGPTTAIPLTDVPISWFVNLETLFEEAVREAIRQAGSTVTPWLNFDSWRSLPRNMIRTMDEYRAKPDVIGRTAGSVPIILDAKYKELKDRPDASDLHQLVAHAMSYEAQIGVLVFPHPEYGFHYLGETAPGHDLCFASLSLSRLREDAARLLKDLLSTEPIRTALGVHQPGLVTGNLA